jgi:hypothetical protein
MLSIMESDFGGWLGGGYMQSNKAIFRVYIAYSGTFSVYYNYTLYTLKVLVLSRYSRPIVLPSFW